jgi:hypothetical protein
MTETDQSGLIRLVTPLTGTGLSRIRTGPSLVLAFVANTSVTNRHECHELLTGNAEVSSLPSGAGM